jgi:hypothetical protein
LGQDYWKPATKDQEQVYKEWHHVQRQVEFPEFQLHKTC